MKIFNFENWSSCIQFLASGFYFGGGGGGVLIDNDGPGVKDGKDSVRWSSGQGKDEKESILRVGIIECEGWRQHSSLINLILLLTKPNIEVSGWLYQTKTHFTHIVYQPFSRVSPTSFTLYGWDQEKVTVLEKMSFN